MRQVILLGACLALLAGGFSAQAQAPEPIYDELKAALEPLVPLEEGWRQPPRLARTRCWWWWLNGNVTPESITRDLEEMKAKGFGGANIIDAGGADQRGNKQVPHGPDFASPEWRKLFTHAIAEADRLGLEMGFNIVSGWNLGGPLVGPEHAAKVLTYSEMTIEGGDVDVALPQPTARDNYYRDIAVVAFPLDAAKQADTGMDPTASGEQSEHPLDMAFDGREDTFWVSPGNTAGQGPSENNPEWIQMDFDTAVAADALRITPRPGYGPKQVALEALRDGGTYEEMTSLNLENRQTETISFEPVTARSFRLVVTDSYDPNAPGGPRNVQIAELALLHDDKPYVQAQETLPRIHNFEQKAYYAYPGSFTATKAWHLLETQGDPDENACNMDEVRDITQHVDADGRLKWDAPQGQWKVIRLGYTPSGAHVSTHSEGWAGPAIDYLSREAFEFYWDEVMDPIIAEVEPYLGTSLRYLHTDSWELGPVNWTPKMPAEFKRISGYDITSFIPALAGYVVENRDVSTRFLNDFRVALALLIAENKYMTFSNHAHELGVGIHPESGGPHAGPFDALLNLGRNDMIMGEFWARSETHRVTDEQRIFVKQTASAAHTYGKRVALAEAFTSIGPHWERDPQQLKPVFDRVSCEGHNLTMWHTFDASPKEMGIPGQVYFAGTHLNPQVTWWDQSHAFISYMNRTHFLLQQGLFVGDVVYFYGQNIPAFVRLQREDPAQVLPGYDYDVINKEALMHRASVKDSRIAMPDGSGYRLLVLPEHDAISLETMEHIAKLVEGGATVVGKKPAKRLDLTGYPEADERFTELTAHLWDEVGAEGNANGGRVIADKTAREVLQADGVPLDFDYEADAEDAHIDYIHRRTDKADIYFVVNRNPEWVEADCTFRVSGKQPELWDPITTEVREAQAFSQAGGLTTVPLRLEPNGAVFVIFTKSISEDVSGEAETNFLPVQAVKTLEGPWRVQFDPEWGPKEPVTFQQLISWPEHENPEVRFFSGEATYHNTFTLDSSAVDAQELYLELGKVQNLAEVTLNGKDLGVVWTDPFRVEITDAAKAGENKLEVTLVNMWPNRIIGDQHLPPEQRRTETNVTKFTKETPLLPSGLLGPVKVLAAN